MLAVVISLLIAAPPQSSSPSPPALQDQLKAAQETYAQAQQVFHDSCDTRAYAAYDDICNQLRARLHDYAVDVDRLTRKLEDEAAKARRP